MIHEQCPACGGAISRVRVRFLGSSDLFSCPACRSECLVPQPDDARLAEIYGSGYYRAWDLDADHALERMKRGTFGWILRCCPLEPSSYVLDVGCATGFFLRLGLDSGFKMWGLDLNAFAIERCMREVPEAQVHCGVLADHPFRGTSFDAIFMVDFIEHVRDPRRELEMAAERLVDGGHVVISTPRADSSSRRLMGRGWFQYKEEHLTYFSLPGLSGLLGQCGLEVVHARSTRKTLTLGYAHRLLQAYPHTVLTPLSRAAWLALPFLRTVPVPVQLGEMTIVARKRGGRPTSDVPDAPRG